MKLELTYPVYPFHVNQQFGDNQACTYQGVIGARVVGKEHGVCPPGYSELYPLLGMKGHTGLDLYAAHGAPCYYAAAEGVVTETSLEVHRGLGVGVTTENKYMIGQWGEHYATTRYWHFLAVSVVEGQKVKRGDLLGYCDSTGISGGDHNHFELKPRDENGVNIYQDNGYYGAVDPISFFNGKYSEDYNQGILMQKVGLYKQLARLWQQVKLLAK